MVGDQHQHSLSMFQNLLKVAKLRSWCLMLANFQQNIKFEMGL
jgi:hypothetical protein